MPGPYRYDLYDRIGYVIYDGAGNVVHDELCDHDSEYEATRDAERLIAELQNADDAENAARERF